MKKFLMKLALPSVLACTALLATACPPPTPPAVSPWKFNTTSLKVNEAQDGVWVNIPFVGRTCVAIPNCNDEPYVMNVNFTVKIGGGTSNNAQAFVTGGHGNGHG